MKKNQKITCSACGTSPVNHHVMYIASIIESLIIEPLEILLSHGIDLKQSGWIINNFTKFHFGVLKLFGMVKYSNDVEKACSGRSKLIWEEAVRRGIPMQQVIIWGRPLEHYKAKINGKWIHFESLPIPAHLEQSAYAWLDDKFILKNKLRKASIAVPRSKKAFTLRGAKKSFDSIEKPVIVKPISGSRGRHTTTNIRTLEELANACRLCRQISPFFVVEEHLFGSVYRATVVGNKLVGFYRADPPQVTGDGMHTIEELVIEKNSKKNERLSDIVINDDVLSYIGRKGYTPNTILAQGNTIDLTAKTGRMYGGYTREMLPEVHPKMHEIFERASHVIPAPILGFDLIIPDPTSDPDTQKWGIIECNSLPFIDLHYFALEGTPRDIAPYIWDLWKK